MLQMYSIRDSKGASFDKPFFTKHVAEATRAVQSAFEMPENQQPWFCKYPADFALFFIGTFDPATGQIMPTSDMAPVWVIEVASLVPAKDMPGGAP